MSGSGKKPNRDSVAIIGPVVWGSVWGHGPELARFLGRERPVVWIDPLVPPGAAKPSFLDRQAYAVPSGVEVVRRATRLRAGLLYGIAMELRNLAAAVRCGAGSLVTYYPLGCLLALFWARLSGRRTLFIYADRPDVLTSWLAGWLARRLFLPATATLAGACLATSSLLREDLRRFKPPPLLLPNGVDLAELSQPAAAGEETGRFCAGFVGYFGEWVDFDLVFEAARRLREVDFVLVGDGPRMAEVREKAAKLANVRLAGALAHAEVFGWIDRMHLGLVPFRVNGLTDRISPVKLFEYWARGRPVLATGCHELKLYAGRHPQALSLFEDSAGLAGLIESFRGDSRAWKAASTAALLAVRDYDWRAIGLSIAGLLGGRD